MIQKLIHWFFAFFPFKARPQEPVHNFTQKQLEAKLPVAFEGMKVNDDSAWNPLLKYPRNATCFCGSGFKAKRCCLPNLELAVSKEAASRISPLIKEIR